MNQVSKHRPQLTSSPRTTLMPPPHDIRAHIARTDEWLKQHGTSAHTYKIVGISNCSIGAIFLIIAIVNTCIENYDYAILCSAPAAISTLLGTINISEFFHTKHQIQQMQELQQRLKSLVHHTWSK